MDRIEKDGFTFSVTKEHDHDAGTPWEREDGHGPVSDWESRDKLPGELILNSDHGSKRFYDFAEACRIALRDGWGARGAEPGMSKRQIAALAAREDYENLLAWCHDQWEYVGVIVTLLDIEGKETDAVQSLWGVDDNGDYADIVASDLVGDCICDIRSRLSYDGDGTRYTSGSRTWIISEVTE